MTTKRIPAHQFRAAAARPERCGICGVWEDKHVSPATVDESIRRGLDWARHVLREEEVTAPEEVRSFTRRAVVLELRGFTVPELEAWLAQEVGRRRSGRAKRPEVLAEIAETFEDACLSS